MFFQRISRPPSASEGSSLAGSHLNSLAIEPDVLFGMGFHFQVALARSAIISRLLSPPGRAVPSCDQKAPSNVPSQ